MTTVILVIHIMICAAMVALVLLQRSEGGALGIGGGGGGGFMTGRGTANLLTRATAMLAAGFFATSIILTILAQRTNAPASILDGANSTGQTQNEQTGDDASGANLPDLKPAAPKLPTSPEVPKSQ